MRGSFKNFGNRPSGDRVLDLYYLNRILEHHLANKDDAFIQNDLMLSKEKLEKYKNRLKREGKLT